jgi:hypothetical protein
MKSGNRSEGGGADCYFCGQPSPGDIYEFYAGFCEDYQRTRAFLSNTVHIKATYSGLKRYGVSICDACATDARRKRHLPGLIGWGLAAVGCGIGAAIVFVMNAAGDQTIYLLGVLGLFGGLSALLAVLEAWALARPGSSPAVTLKLLEEVKTDRALRDKGDSFFAPEEYQVMFKDAPDQPLTAEEILSRDRTGGKGRREPKRNKAQDSKACPFCQGEIPTYAQACPHCKKILG